MEVPGKLQEDTATSVLAPTKPHSTSAPIVPTRWERLICERPLAVMAGTFTCAILLTIIFAANPASLSNGGFRARWHPIAQKADAFDMLGTNQGDTDTGAYFFYESSGESILREESLREICQLETRFFTNPRYPENCERHWDQQQKKDVCDPVAGSLVSYLFEYSDPTCAGARINTALDLVSMASSLNCTHAQLSSCQLRSNWQEIIGWVADPNSISINGAPLPAEAIGAIDQARRLLFGNDFTAAKPITKYMRSSFTVHWFEGFVVDVVNKDSACDMSRCDLGFLTAYYFAENTFERQMWQDMQLVFVSIIVVFFYIWFNTQSLFLASCGIFEVFISFPMAFFIWSTVLQFKHFGILMMMVLFIILGIGADDIFVIQDAWRQSALQRPEISGSTQTRFSWAYRRASNAMLVTSITTCMAFVAAATTPVPAIMSFGIFAACVVAFDFFMVISWFAAALMVHDRYLSRKNESCTGCAAVGIRCDRCLGCIPYTKCNSACMPHGLNTDNVAFSSDGTVNVEHLRPVERFFCRLVPRLHGANKPLLAFFAVLGAVAVGVSAAMLKPAKRLPDMFPKDHALTKLNDIAGERFYRNSEDEKVRLQVVWGFDLDKPIDRGSSDMLSEEDFGTPVYDPYWRTTAAQRQMQTEMLLVCQQAPDFVPTYGGPEQAEKGLVTKHADYSTSPPTDVAEVYCWASLLKDYLEKVANQTFPTDNLAQVLQSDGFRSYRHGLAQQAVSPEVRNYLSASDLDWGISGARISDDGQWVKVAWAAFNTTIRWDYNGIPTDETRMWYDSWNEFMWTRTDAAGWDGKEPKAFHTQSELWPFMALVEILLTGVLEGVIFSLVFAFVVLLVSSSNIAVTCMSFSAICGIVVTVFLTMVAAGWEVSILESVCLILIVGMSVDYTVHLMHSYRNAPIAGRLPRTTIALTEMGISVLSGALTTFLAAAPMFASVFYFFFQFGSFIAMITVFSLFWAIVYLMTLASTVGPETKPDTGWLYGDIAVLRNKWAHLERLCCSRCNNQVGDVVATEGSSAATENAQGADGSAVVKVIELEEVLEAPGGLAVAGGAEAGAGAKNEGDGVGASAVAVP